MSTDNICAADGGNMDAVWFASRGDHDGNCGRLALSITEQRQDHQTELPCRLDCGRDRGNHSKEGLPASCRK